MMATRRVHCVAVTGIAEDQGEPLVWGIVSDLDVVRRAVRTGFDRTAGELASRSWLPRRTRPCARRVS
jgi:hypothetical protein